MQGRERKEKRAGENAYRLTAQDAGKKGERVAGRVS
jgi:hypothetical protein